MAISYLPHAVKRQPRSPRTRPARGRAAAALSFKRRLLNWYRRVGRELPWRETRDPYAVLVSEFMLQQTQVSRVERYYPRFLDRYPTLADLARARPAKVREAWEGLGYYRRAENLHRLAQAVVKDYGGRLPSDPEVLATLPGVGRYTAGAVSTFAYERPAAAVDTNVARVLTRVFRPRRGQGGGATADRVVWDLAGTMLPRRGRTAWEYSQALMDLGATVCTARKPKCGQCPVRPACKSGGGAGNLAAGRP